MPGTPAFLFYCSGDGIALPTHPPNALFRDTRAADRHVYLQKALKRTMQRNIKNLDTLRLALLAFAASAPIVNWGRDGGP